MLGDINDEIREALVDKEDVLESVEVLSESQYADLPKNVHEKLGIVGNQKMC